VNRCLRYRRSKQHRGPASSPPPSSKPTLILVEDWQIVKPRCVHCRAPSTAPRSYSPRYLAAVESRCLNCLFSFHMRADRCLLTRCFNCHGLCHHLRDCKRPRKSSLVIGVSDAVSQAPQDTLEAPLVLRHPLLLVAFSSPTSSSPWSRCAPSHTRGISWLMRQHWEQQLLH
jgi:hypothetical protein